MPNIVVEALACGIPVVATDVGEVPFLIEPGKHGYIVDNDYGSVPALTNALKETLDQEWDSDSIASRVKDFTWESAARIIESAIQRATHEDP